MNNTLNRLSRDRLSGQPEQYKKFNPNPTPQRSWWDIEKPFEPVKPFPSYEEWKTQVEAGTLPEEFKKEVPGKELLEQHGGLPLELQTPTEQPTETGMPTEVPGEVSPDSSQAFFDMISELSTAQIEELDERGVFDKFFPDLAPPVEEDLPVDLTTEEGIYKAMESEQIPIALGRLLLEREHPLEEGIVNIQTDITRMIDEGLIYEDILYFLTNKEEGLGLSNSEASAEIATWVEKNKQDIPLVRK